MDKYGIGTSMEHTFEEQCHLQLSLLKKDLIERGEAVIAKKREQRFRRPRLFKSNIFEEVEPHKKQYLERTLCYTLKSFGVQIQNNLIAAARDTASSLATTPTPISDLASEHNSRPASRLQSPSPSFTQTFQPYQLGRPRKSHSDDLLKPVTEVVTISSDEECDDDVGYIKEEPLENNETRGDNVRDEPEEILNRSTQEQDQRSDISIDVSLNSETLSSEELRTKIMSVRIDPCNFIYDHYGVIHLKPKEQIKFSIPGIKKQAFYLHLIVKILKLISTDTYMTKRELFYGSQPFCKVKNIEKPATQPAPTSASNTTGGGGGEQSSNTQFNVFGQNTTQGLTQANCNTQASATQQADSQWQEPKPERYSTARLDAALDDLCCLLGCSRLHLRILSQAKGLVYGNLKFRLKNGITYDCLSKREGLLLPTSHHPIVDIESNAKFVLVVEKDSVFQQILLQEPDSHFIENYKAILFTAKGYPDIVSRAFLNFLGTKLKLPMVALTDADPHGLEILCTYKFGAFATAYDSLYTTVPHMKWLGVLPSDLLKLGPLRKELKHSPNDLKKMRSLTSRRFLKMRPSWLYQLEIMKNSGRKVELENLDEENGKYLVKTYLPNKLRFASWL